MEAEKIEAWEAAFAAWLADPSPETATDSRPGFFRAGFLAGRSEVARAVAKAKDDLLYRAWHRIADAANAMKPSGVASTDYTSGMWHVLDMLKRMGALAREGAPADPRMLEEMEARSRAKEDADG